MRNFVFFFYFSSHFAQYSTFATDLLLFFEKIYPFVVIMVVVGYMLKKEIILYKFHFQHLPPPLLYVKNGFYFYILYPTTFASSVLNKCVKWVRFRFRSRWFFEFSVCWVWLGGCFNA